MNRSLRSPTCPAPCCSTLLPIHGGVRDPSSARKFRLCREKTPAGSRHPWSKKFSANRSAFVGCSLLLLVMHREVEGRAGAGAGAWRSHPLQVRIQPSPAPGDNTCALGRVCCHAGGERALDGPSSSCLNCVEQELTRIRAGRAQEETEGQEQFVQGLLVVQQGREVQRSTEMDAEGR